MNRFNLRPQLIAALAVLTLAACGEKEAPPAPTVHNLTVDEVTRAQVNAQAHFNGEFPAGQDKAGSLIKKKGSWTSCRPQDSNSNGLVTCSGMIPNMEGGFVASTMYCGYRGGADAVAGCNDKDQR